MTFLVPILGLFGGTAAAGATAGAAATATAATAATGAAAGFSSTAATILGGLATFATVVSQIAGGNEEAESYKTKAFEADMDAKNEKAEGLQRTTAMKRELARILGENEVAFAAAGIDLAGGISESSAATEERRAAQEISIERATAEQRSAMLKARASGYRRMAKQARQKGVLQAFGTGAQYGLSLVS